MFNQNIQPVMCVVERFANLAPVQARGPGQTGYMVITFAIEDCLPSVCQPVVPLAVAHASKAAGIGDFLQKIEVLVFVEELRQTVNLSHWVLEHSACFDQQFVRKTFILTIIAATEDYYCS